jgi:hypothetical protein
LSKVAIVKPDERMVGPVVAHVLQTEIGDEISVYDPKTEQVTVLNGTASDIWRLMDGTLTLTEITNLIAKAYGVESGDVANDVARTISSLMDAGIIESP